MITCLQEIGNFTHPDIVKLIEKKVMLAQDVNEILYLTLN